MIKQIEHRRGCGGCCSGASHSRDLRNDPRWTNATRSRAPAAVQGKVRSECEISPRETRSPIENVILRVDSSGSRAPAEARRHNEI